MRAEKTAIALLNKESVPQEDLDAAISCFMEALDEPKRVVDAAGQLAQVLCAMGLAGMPRERIKALAELLEEKTKDVDNLPFAFYEGCELVFIFWRNMTRHFLTRRLLLSIRRKTQKRILRHCTIM